MEQWIWGSDFIFCISEERDRIGSNILIHASGIGCMPPDKAVFILISQKSVLRFRELGNLVFQRVNVGFQHLFSFDACVFKIFSQH